jgi:hypothetical protein
MQHEAVNCRIWVPGKAMRSGSTKTSREGERGQIGCPSACCRRSDQAARRGMYYAKKRAGGRCNGNQPARYGKPPARQDRRRTRRSRSLDRTSARTPPLADGRAAFAFLQSQVFKPSKMREAPTLSALPAGFQVRRGRDPTLSKTGAVHDISGARGHAHVTRIAHCWSGRSGPWRSKVMSGLGVISP